MFRATISIALFNIAATMATAQTPASIVVVVPTDTIVFFDNYQSQSTGAERRFVSPPLELGFTYTYMLKFVHQGKQLVRPVQIRPGESISVHVKTDEFQTASGTAQPAIKQPTPPNRPGFVVKFSEDRWWIFKAGSKEALDAEKHGVPEKHVTRLNIAPWKITLKAPDVGTLEEYLTAKPGFITKFDDGRLWVFRSGAKEYQQFIKDGELAKQVVRPGAGPRGMTLKGPDTDTLLSYVAAYDGFETFIEDGRVWVFRTGAKELEQFKKNGELEKHVTRINAGPLRMTVKSPDAETIEAYRKAFTP